MKFRDEFQFGINIGHDASDDSLSIAITQAVRDHDSLAAEGRQLDEMVQVHKLWRMLVSRLQGRGLSFADVALRDREMDTLKELCFTSKEVGVIVSEWAAVVAALEGRAGRGSSVGGVQCHALAHSPVVYIGGMVSLADVVTASGSASQIGLLPPSTPSDDLPPLPKLDQWDASLCHAFVAVEGYYHDLESVLHSIDDCRYRVSLYADFFKSENRGPSRSRRGAVASGGAGSSMGGGGGGGVPPTRDLLASSQRSLNLGGSGAAKTLKLSGSGGFVSEAEEQFSRTYSAGDPQRSRATTGDCDERTFSFGDLEALDDRRASLHAECDQMYDRMVEVRTWLRTTLLPFLIASQRILTAAVTSITLSRALGAAMSGSSINSAASSPRGGGGGGGGGDHRHHGGPSCHTPLTQRVLAPLQSAHSIPPLLPPLTVPELEAPTCFDGFKDSAVLTVRLCPTRGKDERTLRFIQLLRDNLAPPLEPAAATAASASSFDEDTVTVAVAAAGAAATASASATTTTPGSLPSPAGAVPAAAADAPGESPPPSHLEGPLLSRLRRANGSDADTLVLSPLTPPDQPHNGAFVPVAATPPAPAAAAAAAAQAMPLLSAAAVAVAVAVEPASTATTPEIVRRFVPIAGDGRSRVDDDDEEEEDDDATHIVPCASDCSSSGAAPAAAGAGAAAATGGVSSALRPRHLLPVSVTDCMMEVVSETASPGLLAHVLQAQSSEECSSAAAEAAEAAAAAPPPPPPAADTAVFSEVEVRGTTVWDSRVTYSVKRLVVRSGGVLTVDAWDGTRGGTLRVRASGEVLVEEGGFIDVSGLGYRGGCGVCADTPHLAQQGEGLNGIGGFSTRPNEGGGGGGVADTVRGCSGGGGGGGGVRAGGDGRRGGGRGGLPEVMGMGCGGGAGHPVAPCLSGSESETSSSDGLGSEGDGGGGGGDGCIRGGRGGGLVWITCAVLNNYGEVRADGCDGTDGPSPGTSAGGGGAGGTVIVTAAHCTNSGVLTAEGGRGGFAPSFTLHRAGPTTTHLPSGGSGSPGTVHVAASPP